MVLGDTAVLSNMPLRLVPEVPDTVDVVLAINKPFRVVGPDVMKIRDVEGVVAGKAIHVDDAIRHDHVLDDGHQGLHAGVGDRSGVDLAATFEYAEDRNLAGGAATPLTLPLTTEVALVRFDLAGHR